MTRASLGPVFVLCSTPFGITEVGTRTRSAWRISCQCAQRLSASQRSALGWDGSRDQIAIVLNAFRHHRGRHNSKPSRWLSRPACSTPFGITEVGTLAGLGAVLAHQGAQRLSASQRSAQAKKGSARRPRDVLNAFRHHRGRHASTGRDCGRAIPVLNAFRHHRGRHWSRSLTLGRPACAQRLSASQRSAPATWTRPSTGSRVLNAFRHHRGRHIDAAARSSQFSSCSTPFGITEVGTPSLRTRLSEGERCSTPFGITEVGTHISSSPPCSPEVLNAFRHHRGRHPLRADG